MDSSLSVTTRLELYGPLFARDVSGFDVADEPVFVGVNPGVEFVIEDQLHDFFHDVGWQDILLEDCFQVGLDDDAAVECGDGLVEFQWFDEHGHAFGRAAAGDGELDSGVAHFE